MSTPINDGGPAFPSGDGYQRALGMTLRDYFAGQALVGLLAHPSGEDPEVAVNFAYRLADAMLEQRARKEGK